jgi:hypothetical protein
MPSEDYVAIWRAVRGREQIAFTHNRKPREAYPVVLGYSADGREALMAYQFGGETSPGNTLPGWRCFHLADIRHLAARRGGWIEGDSHKQPQSCVQHVDVDANIPETLRRPAPLPFGSAELRRPRRGD